MSTTPNRARPSRGQILAGVFECTALQIGVSIDDLSARTRPVLDLGMDSLDLVEWIMAIEDRFDVTLPDPHEVADQVYKQVFTRADFSMGDMAELVHLRWGSQRPPRTMIDPPRLVDLDRAGFAQLGWQGEESAQANAGYERLGKDGAGRELLRRRSDGMPCVVIPGGRGVVGSDADIAGRDEQPVHEVRLSPFVIDLELVSTTAYCRFLNSVGVTDEELLRRWFLLEPDAHRRADQSVAWIDGSWRPRGRDEWPMILVSWHGARAYARWAHGDDPTTDHGPSFLPTEAQWEFAVRGGSTTTWPWGNEDPAPGRLRAGRSRSVRTSGLMPLGPVHAIDETSTFGLRGALGHVWQWCADWYAPDAYHRRALGVSDPEERQSTGVRAERGGSWVGAVSLCRPSYRRGRVPDLRGRCLGFRCAAPAQVVAS